ncbi:MAG: hypothetical protein ACI4HQ_03975 [Acetatifactor sp.]
MKKEEKGEEKQGKKKSRGLFGGVTAIAAAILLFIFGKGFGLGPGLGLGTNADVGESKESESAVVSGESVPEETTESSENTEVTITIEVKQDQYFVDGQEKTLEDIEGLLEDKDGVKYTYVLENNYASAKAWDDIKALFVSREISVVEQ